MGEFIISEHITDIVITALLSMVPTFEGRYAVLANIKFGMPPVFAYLIAFIFSTIPMPFIYWFMKPILKWLYTLPIKPVQRFAAWVEQRSMRKAKSLDTKSLLGLYVFVAIPLPGTGVWTGSGIATLLNMDKKSSMIAIVLGNATACLITTLLGSGVRLFF